MKLDLPTYSGDILDWREFWHLFSARIDRETDLSDYEKISCLENAMEDPEAKTVIRLKAQSGVYADVVKALKARYDRNKLVFQHHIKQLQSLSSISDDHDSYVRFLQSITKHVGGAVTCGGNTFEQLVTAMLEAHLPRPAAVLWSDFSSKDGDCPPTLAKLEEFIENRIQATETLPANDLQPMLVDAQTTHLLTTTSLEHFT